jgi:CubicO group peptidase (beta-lactamase class C family)
MLPKSGESLLRVDCSLSMSIRYTGTILHTAKLPMQLLQRISALPVLAALTFPVSGAVSGDVDHIANIEKGLRPAQALLGTPVPLSTINDEMRRLHVPGLSIAVIDGGQLVWAKGYGVVGPSGAPVTPETLFQAASISKPVAAFGTMTMVQSGELKLYGDINLQLRTWKLPEAPGGKPVSLLHLLSHTGGLNVSGFPGYAQGDAVPTLLQVLEGTPPATTAPIRPASAPGSKWQYSGGGYTVLQQLVTDVSSQAFDVVMQARVLAPFKMVSSSFSQPASSHILKHAALPHDSTGKPYTGGPSTYPELAAAGMWTTPSDLARFVIGVQASVAGHSKVLNQANARTMLTPVRNDYALGFEMAGSGAATSFAHGGSNRGYQNYLFGYVDGGRGAVVMTNGDAGDEVARATMRAIAAEYGWPSYQTVMRAAQLIDPKMAQQMTGKYAIAGLGDFDITVQDGQPMFWIKPGQGEPLYRASETQFFVLSQKLELSFDALPGDTGRIVAGPFDVRFERVH